MINDLIFMNGYGLYVWSAFTFTLLNFTFLYFLIKSQYIKEKKKFVAKYGSLSPESASHAKLQNINKEILSNTSNI